MSAVCIVPKATLEKHRITKLPYFPSFDRVLVYQLPDAVSESWSNEVQIYKPEGTVSRQEKEECRGILLAAAAGAMDHLHSHGIAVGDVVWFSRLAIWRHVAGTVNGKDVEMMFLRSADLVGSEELLQMVLDERALMMGPDAEGKFHWVIDGVERSAIRPAVDEY